jgi:hypothetical protein
MTAIWQCTPTKLWTPDYPTPLSEIPTVVTFPVETTSKDVFM